MKNRRNKSMKMFWVIIGIFFLILSNNYISDSFAFKIYNGNANINDELEIYFFDVGQADSILIKQKDDTMLIDAGNNEDGKNIVNYLKKILLMEDIDIVVGTHPHEDHIGGLDDVINAFEIGTIYMPDAISTSKTFEDVLYSIENKNYLINVPEVDSVFSLGDMKFNILYTGFEESDLNNTSIVLRLEFGETSYLFTGDATSETEKLLLNKKIRADVLKVGHHGSRYSTSSDFLNKVNPDYAIIMVSKDNSYGHPTSETLDKLSSKNIKIYRTDQDGTIKITSDGNNINVETMNVSLNG